jgi:23S rRNA maturation mini-RNase III
MMQNEPQNLDTLFPMLIAYLDDAQFRDLIRNHTMNEASQIEHAFDAIETAMILIHRNAEISSKSAILEAITTIWDNSRDLAFDED